jgi:hypothetical protein
MSAPTGGTALVALGRPAGDVRTGLVKRPKLRQDDGVRLRSGARAGTSLEETAGIDAWLSGISTEDFDLARRLCRRLGPVVQRGVPPRAIEAGPVPRAARLRFADGTTVVVRSTAPGDLALLALAMRQGSVRTAACTTDAHNKAQLLLACPGSQRQLWLRVVGFDQPD